MDLRRWIFTRLRPGWNGGPPEKVDFLTLRQDRRHPDRGEMQPSIFMPVAETFGLIIHLGEWSLHDAHKPETAGPWTVQVSADIKGLWPSCGE